MADTTDNSTPSRGWSKIAFNIGATIFLGAVGSGIWEIMFRPGLTVLGTSLSFISEYYDNQIYSAAALDPQPVPGLILLLIVCMVPVAVAQICLWLGFIRKPFESFLDRRLERRIAAADSPEARRKALDRALKVTALIGFTGSVIFWIFVMVGFSLQNESTLVWRVFNANIEIASPKLSDQQVKILRSEFRRMKTREEFRIIEGELNDAVKSSGIKLDWYSM